MSEADPLSAINIVHSLTLPSTSVSPPIQRSDQSIQRGGNVDQNINHNGSPQRVVSQTRFNNIEIRQVLNFPPPQDEADHGLYYRDVMGSVDEVLRETLSHGWQIAGVEGRASVL